MIFRRHHKLRIRRLTALVGVLCWLLAGDGVATALNLWLGSRDGLHQSYATTTHDGRTVLVLSHAEGTQADLPERSFRLVSACPNGRTQDHQVSQLEIESSQHRKIRQASSMLAWAPLPLPDEVSFVFSVSASWKPHLASRQMVQWHQAMLVRASQQVLRC